MAISITAFLRKKCTVGCPTCGGLIIEPLDEPECFINQASAGWTTYGTFFPISFLLVEIGEGLALFRQSLQQRRRLPQLAVLYVELADALVNFLQADSVRVPHRAAAPCRIAISVDVDDVYVNGPQRDAFFQNLRAFVDQRVLRTFDDLFFGNLAAIDALLGRDLFDQRVNFLVGNPVAVLVVFVPARASLLAVTPHLAQTVRDFRITYAGLLQMRVFFANAPADVESGQIADGKRPHSHSEFVKRAVDVLRRRALFDQELRLAAVLMQHPVADEAVAIAHDHADLFQSLRQRHRGRDHFLARRLAADDFEQSHHVRRAEVMMADDEFRPRRGRRDFINVQRRGVRRQNRAGLGHTIDFAEDLLLQFHPFEDGLSDDVGFFKTVVGKLRLDQRHTLTHHFLREAAFLDGVLVVFANRRHPAIQRLLRHLSHDYRDAGVGVIHRDPAAHRPSADDRGLFDFENFRVFRRVGNLRDFALAEEDVDHRLRLIREKALFEQFGFAGDAFFKREFRRRLDGVDCGYWRHHPARGLLGLSARGFKDGCIGRFIAEFVVALARLRRLFAAGDLFAQESDRALQQISLDNSVNDSKPKGFFRADRITVGAHLRGPGDARQSRQPLRAGRAGNYAQLDLGLADLGRWNSDAVMKAHCGLQTAAESRAMDRGDQGLRTIFYRLDQIQKVEVPFALA